MKSKSLILLLSLLFTSCVISINSNYYKLNRSYKQHFLTAEQQCNDFCLTKINASEVKKKLVEKEEFVWVHLWRSWCTSASCKSLRYYEDMANENKNVRLLLISETYAYMEIKKICEAQAFQNKMYVIDYQYGNNLTKIRKAFVSELLNAKCVEGDCYASDFVFKKGSLIYKGSDLSPDSLRKMVQN